MNVPRVLRTCWRNSNNSSKRSSTAATAASRGHRLTFVHLLAPRLSLSGGEATERACLACTTFANKPARSRGREGRDLSSEIIQGVHKNRGRAKSGHSER